ncbi:MAG: hypothetical protein HC840_12250 [Leptolyngbyaceae cyanobacterium RM2_2_4]|nr:hypothetical protein [Leptolyngbyaceae cyanobacterium SM1_4_3]NJN89804.1 hypothetical protein [Leptolyngbyaceae cyanobacterium SL_5_14]NJO50071.1 hypothetical protein [Leptolyngbyaceae cyanobacterium RM2_2_4]
MYSYSPSGKTLHSYLGWSAFPQTMPLEQSHDHELNYSSKSLDSRNELGKLGQRLGNGWSDRHTFLTCP